MENQPPEITAEMLQENPALIAALLVVFGLMMLFASGGIGSWIYFGMRFRNQQPLLPVEPWRPRVWGLIDLLMVLVAVFLGQSLFAVIGVRLLNIDVAAIRAVDGDLPLSLSMIASVGNLAAMVAGVLWIQARFSVGLAHIGFSARNLPWHLLLGLLVGLATLPVVYVLMILVSLGLDTEYAHPLIEQMTEQGSLSSYVYGVITAAIIAPLAEEFLFRVILQGWMQSIQFKSVFAIILGGYQSNRSAAASEGSLALPASENLYAEITAPEQTAAATEQPLDMHVDSTTWVPPIWPSVVTGILFGLAHWGYGLSFIPLIVLGIVLGLVYRATHSIWPCVLIHFMLNGTSMAMLGLVLLQQSAAN
jgi:membrane protease YdiL (CAAX protease family)